ncbi:MAG TPA: BamA/TamA family outer membrane protein, partial [Myxococcales bacterium]|nr:BamA/TamA family outer membrane protein [Myxococcales bacterium]
AQTGVDFVTLVEQSGGQAQQCVRPESNSCILAYPELRYTYDSRDNILEPTHGFFGTVSFQQTLPLGDFRYFRVEPEMRAYFPIRSWLVLAGRTHFGALMLQGGNQDPLASPFSQRFFGGGQGDQRGYAPLGQGPKAGGSPRPIGPFADPGMGYFTTYAALGGNGTFLLSGELRFRTDFIFPHLGLVLFADASRITPKPSLPWEGRLEVSQGIGVRYLTPFGPIRFDIAYLLNPQTVVARGSPGHSNDTPVGPDCIEATNQCIFQRRWAYHITLGEAF